VCWFASVCEFYVLGHSILRICAYTLLKCYYALSLLPVACFTAYPRGATYLDMLLILLDAWARHKLKYAIVYLIRTVMSKNHKKCVFNLGSIEEFVVNLCSRRSIIVKSKNLWSILTQSMFNPCSCCVESGFTQRIGAQCVFNLCSIRVQYNNIII